MRKKSAVLARLLLIELAVRTAYDDGGGGAHNAHDANYLTFHRFRNFRRLTLADSVVDPQQLGMPPRSR